MKLDKWPEEIECDGWRWKLSAGAEMGCSDFEDPYYFPPLYYKYKKLHVPPTIQEIFQHLIDGGWVKAEYKDTIAYWRLDKYGSKELQVAFQEKWVKTLLRFNKSCDFTFAYEGMKVTLVKSGVEDLYVGSAYVGSR